MIRINFLDFAYGIWNEVYVETFSRILTYFSTIFRSVLFYKQISKIVNFVKFLEV